MIGELPKSLRVCGKEYAIRTDFNDILRIIEAFNDPELDKAEKIYVCLFIIYEDFYSLPQEAYEEAYREAVRFIDCGKETSSPKAPRTIDWEQDAMLIFPAINHVAGFKTRLAKYVHWWSFMGFFMEIREGIFAVILKIREKRAKGKPLEKWEKEFLQANKDICVLRKKLTEEERGAKDRLNAMLS